VSSAASSSRPATSSSTQGFSIGSPRRTSQARTSLRSLVAVLSTNSALAFAQSLMRGKEGALAGSTAPCSRGSSSSKRASMRSDGSVSTSYPRRIRADGLDAPQLRPVRLGLNCSAEVDKARAAHGWDEDQRWALARVAILVGGRLFKPWPTRAAKGTSPAARLTFPAIEAALASPRRPAGERLQPHPAGGHPHALSTDASRVPLLS
jgi:hypothetical protein